jgi:hypothetical protein
MKEPWVIIMCMCLSVGFIGCGAGVFFGLIKPPLEAENILKNGTETTATVIALNSGMSKGSGSSGTKTEYERYYNFTLSFFNEKGEEITFKTGNLYPEQFIREQGIASYNEFSHKYNKIEKKTLQVMYKGKKAVLKDFVPEIDTGDKLLWIFPVVFGGTGIVLFIAVVFGFINIVNDKQIKKYGTPATGVYLKHEESGSSGKDKLYVIYFAFKNEWGEYFEDKTACIYDKYEAEVFETMQSFPVKFKGNKAVIMVDKNEILRFKAENLQNSSE